MLRLYDTLTRAVTSVALLEPLEAKMYTCGPTVYRDAHIGNLRTYLMADWIRRILNYQGIGVTHVKNITDVGHMRQEILDRGEDKVIAAAIAEGKTPGDIAGYYTKRFIDDESKLNILPSQALPKASEHIPEMITIIDGLVNKGYAYVVEGNVYFEVSRFSRYGQLSGNVHDTQVINAVRIEPDPLKRDPRDFALWKRAEPGRTLKWTSPWSEGFPGWHIECSAMSLKYLGQRFDIHTGGVDNVFPHHEDELAQSEGFLDGKVVSHWVHAQHLLADGVKMAKSSGNTYTLSDIESMDIDPMAFRYLCMTARYRSRLNFTFTALKAAQRGLLRLRNQIWKWNYSSENDSFNMDHWSRRFAKIVNNDLDMPGALALTWKLVHSSEPEGAKLKCILSFDEVLGLGLEKVFESYAVPIDVKSQLVERACARVDRNYVYADSVRSIVESQDYIVEDSKTESRARPKTPWEKRREHWVSVSSSAEVPSLLNIPSEIRFTVGVVARNYLSDVDRCVESILRWAKPGQIELVVVDNGCTDGTSSWLDSRQSHDSRIRVIHADHMLGEAAARNLILKQSLGELLILLDTSVEITGDVYDPLEHILADHNVGVAGPYGLRTDNMHHFHDGAGETGEMDAMQSYCFSFRRADLLQVGLMRESFRFYRNLDIDFSFQFKAQGLSIVADPELAVRRYEHRGWNEFPEAERDKLSRVNYGKFLKRWRDRSDLLVCNRG